MQQQQLMVVVPWWTCVDRWWCSRVDGVAAHVAATASRRPRHIWHRARPTTGKLEVIHNTEALTSSSASLAAATSKTSPLTDPQGRPVSQSR